MIPKLIMLVGLPASGKSTYAKSLLDENTIILSSDNIRVELYNNINDQEHNEKVFRELHKRLKDNLKSGVNVIYDATNISSKRRKGILTELNKIDCKKECHIIATPMQECLKNDDTRNRHVGEEVIKRMWRSFQTPYYFEGWNEIKIIYLKEEYKCIYSYSDIKYKLEGFNQENPYHSLDLWKHCQKAHDEAKNIFVENCISYSVVLASLYHDFGKYFTKVKDEENIAHYFGHENVGAYEILFLNEYFANSMKLDISILINLHMKMYDPNFKEDKYRKLWGEELYSRLKIVHECDVKAHLQIVYLKIKGR